MPSKPDPVANLNDPVTEHMRQDCALLDVNQTVGEALLSIRKTPPAGRIIYFYVVDSKQQLIGVVPTRRLLLNSEETPVREIMVTGVISIPANATVLEACEFFLLHRLLAFPVIDATKRLLGTVDVELYTDEIADLERREGNHDLFQLIGVHLNHADQKSPVSAFRSRFPWLMANILGGIMAAFLAGFFENQLQKVVALALFIPVVLALAESVSIQSVSLTLQVLHGQTVTLRWLASRLRVEFATGVFLGVASAFCVAIVATLWLWQPVVTFCLLGGIAGGVTCAATLGVAIPNLLHLLNREPQVAAGPVALASTDIITLLIYFSLARWLIGP